MRSYGSSSQFWPQRALDAPYAVTDTTAFHDAFVDAIETKRNGEPAGLIAIIEHPRRRLLKAIYSQLVPQGTTYDVFLQRMEAFRTGNISVNGTPQANVEASLDPPAVASAYEHAIVTADRVVFRSRYELELASRLFNVRPSRYEVCAPIDPSVPAPASTPGSSSGAIAIWIGEGDDALTELARTLVSDLPVSANIVRAGHDAESALSRAHLIVSFNDDPGTAIALARFGRPLCAATPAAAEYLRDVAVFEVWDTSAAIEAIQRSFGALPPTLREEAITALPDLRRTPPLPDSTPLTTIVITVYDRLRHLEQTLERLQKQTYPNIEIIVVSNNGPRADDICARFPNVRYIHRNENSGAAGETRNDGITAARGEYITTLDDDDIFFDDHIETMVGLCERGADVVYSDFLIQVVEPRDGQEILLGYDIEIGKAITAHELLVQNRIGYMTIFARRSVYESFPIAYDQINAYGASEVELWLRMAKRFALVKSPTPTTLYTIRQNWKGSKTAIDHFIFADGYERMYKMYPTPGLPLIEERRIAHVASLRAASQSPPRHARYLVKERAV